MGLLGTAAFLKEHEPTSAILSAAGPLLPLVLLLIFTFAFTLGLGPVPWVLIGELFPAHARSLAAGFTTFCCFSTIFFANFSFLFLVKTIGRWGDLTIKIICFLYKYES